MTWAGIALPRTINCTGVSGLKNSISTYPMATGPPIVGPKPPLVMAPIGLPSMSVILVPARASARPSGPMPTRFFVDLLAI